MEKLKCPNPGCISYLIGTPNHPKYNSSAYRFVRWFVPLVGILEIIQGFSVFSDTALGGVISIIGGIVVLVIGFIWINRAKHWQATHHYCLICGYEWETVEEHHEYN